MKQLSLFFSIFFFSLVGLSGGRETGGGFVDSTTRPVLQALANQLAARIQSLPPDYFQIYSRNVPKEWSPERVAHVIRNLKFDLSGRVRSRQGRQLMMDFNRRKGTITVLSPFLLAYNESLSRGAGDPLRTHHIDVEMVLQIWQKLAHEVSHLWGLNEQQAEHFSENLIWAVKYHTLVCNFNVPSPFTEPVPNHMVFNFGDSILKIYSGAYSFDGPVRRPYSALENLHSQSMLFSGWTQRFRDQERLVITITDYEFLIHTMSTEENVFIYTGFLRVSQPLSHYVVPMVCFSEIIF